MWYIRWVVLMCLLSAGTGLAQQNLRLDLLKRDTQIFEGIVRGVLKQSFTDPFAVTAEPRGAYLQGYGVIFTFQITVGRTKIRTAFGEIDLRRLGETMDNRRGGDKSGKATSRVRDQLGVMKESMIQTLQDYGSTIKQLGGHDHIAITAYVKDRSVLDEMKSSKVMVLTTTKDDVDLVAMKKISADSFKGRVHIVEY